MKPLLTALVLVALLSAGCLEASSTVKDRLKKKVSSSSKCVPPGPNPPFQPGTLTSRDAQYAASRGTLVKASGLYSSPSPPPSSGSDDCCCHTGTQLVPVNQQPTPPDCDCPVQPQCVPVIQTNAPPCNCDCGTPQSQLDKGPSTLNLEGYGPFHP